MHVCNLASVEVFNKALLSYLLTYLRWVCRTSNWLFSQCDWLEGYSVIINPAVIQPSAANKNAITGSLCLQGNMPAFRDSVVSHVFFARRGDTLHSWSRAKFHIYRAKMWDYSPKTAEIWNFTHKFIAFIVRLYSKRPAFMLLIWSLLVDRQPSGKNLPSMGASPPINIR